jgi:hypothetical protein
MQGMWRSALAATAMLAPAACGGVAAPTTTWTDPAAHLGAQIPRGWHVVPRRLTAVSSPQQRLVVTSFPLHQRGPDPGCGPVTALRQLPAAGAMLYVFEYRGPTRRAISREPPRPRHFALDPHALATYECLGRSYLLRFRDHGRVLQAHVYLGPRASAATRRRVLAVLDSLRVGRPDPRAAAVWVAPRRVLSRAPYLAVACPRPNRFACDRVGLAVWLRGAAVSVSATVDGRPLALDDARWSGPVHGGRRRMFAGFLHPAGLLDGPLKLRSDDGPGRWIGRHPVQAGVGLLIERDGRRFVRTSLRVRLSAGWG